jgi:hypothetical protein
MGARGNGRYTSRTAGTLNRQIQRPRREEYPPHLQSVFANPKPPQNPRPSPAALAVGQIKPKFNYNVNGSKESRFNVSAEDIRSYPWQGLLADCSQKECINFYEVLIDASKKCKEEEDDLGNRVYGLLYVIASFYPNYDMMGNPYGSLWSFEGQRSLNTEDLTDEDLAALAEIVHEIKDPEYRARVADVLWVTKKNYKTAQLAIDAFLESAERLKTGDMWPPYVERLDRAARLASHRGFEIFETKVVSAVESAIREFEWDTNSGILCLKLMAILLFLNKGDNVRYSALAERFAEDFSKAGDWHFSESYWVQAEQWHRLAKNEFAAVRCRLAAAECNISRSEAGLINQISDFGYRAHWLGRGLQALREANADPKRIQEIHQKFLEMEKMSLSEMATIELDREAIPGLAEAEAEAQKRSADFVRGQPFWRALIRIANITRPVILTEISKQYENISEETIWDKIVTTTAVDHFGKVIDVIEPVGTGSHEEEAVNQRKRLFQHARTIHWPSKVTWFIEPARLSLMEEHQARHKDLHFLILNNPFIPTGHEGIYLRGLQAGFHGDWLMAMHLLVPQIENSIRHILKVNGNITTSLRNGIQAEQSIIQLLERQDVIECFGEDLVFNLRGMLIEDFGHNIRNDLAHGLVPEGAFYNASSVYLWWLILHICWQGFVIGNTPPDNSSNGSEPKTGDL